MPHDTHTNPIDAIRHAAIPIAPDDHYDALLREIGDASVVLLGEATHGTAEFYRARAAISRRLITDKGFDAIAVEADWPDALRLSRYLRGGEPAPEFGGVHDRTVHEALRGFTRFPLWMWRNTELVAFAEWLHDRNGGLSAQQARIGFYGLDLYSLRTSMDAVVRYLEQVDPEAARRARARYGCFDHLAEDPQRYGYAATFGMRKDCEDEVVRQLVALTTVGRSYVSPGDTDAADALFYAQQNARVAQEAERYYRTMFEGGEASWNLRDTHMADTLDALRAHLGKRNGRPAKIVVWAHNSHIGDARATEMGERGELNLGQLMRQRHGTDEVFLLGFTTHGGTVTAASEWDSPAELKTVRPARADSIEHLFHQTGIGDFLLPLRGHDAVAAALEERRLERAIGVIYLPESERISHYFHAAVARQFDAVLHIDMTTALHPLDDASQRGNTETPETYPSGI